MTRFETEALYALLESEALRLRNKVFHLRLSLNAREFRLFSLLQALEPYRTRLARTLNQHSVSLKCPPSTAAEDLEDVFGKVSQEVADYGS